MAALSDLAQRFAIPVVAAPPAASVACRRPSLPSRLRPDAVLDEADAILVLECDVPWVPSLKAPRPRCQVDPSRRRPAVLRAIRFADFRAIWRSPARRRLALPKLGAAIDRHIANSAVDARRQRVAERRGSTARRLAKNPRDGRRRYARSTWPGSAHASPSAQARDAILVNEYTLMNEHCPIDSARLLFRVEPGRGARLGRRGGARRRSSPQPDRLVIATFGDGSHLFGNPVAVHHAAAVHDLPVLFVDHQQFDVGRGAAGDAARMYPHGEAMRSNKPPLIDLDELPAFEQICAASGRLRRAGRGSGSPAGRARTRAPCGHDRQASGASQRYLPRAMSPSSPFLSAVGHGAICQARDCAG